MRHHTAHAAAVFGDGSCLSKAVLPRAGQARPDGKRRRGLAGHQRGASDRLRCGPAGGREAPRAASGFRGRRFMVVDVGGSGLDPRHAPSGNPQLFTIRWPGRDVAQQSGGYERHTFIPHRAFFHGAFSRRGGEGRQRHRAPIRQRQGTGPKTEHGGRGRAGTFAATCELRRKAPEGPAACGRS